MTASCGVDFSSKLDKLEMETLPLESCWRREREKQVAAPRSSLASVGRKGLPLLLGFVKDQYVATYVLQLPEVSDGSLETLLFVFFTPKVMTPTVSLRVQMHPGRSSFPSQIGSRGWRLLGAIRLLLQEEVGRAGQAVGGVPSAHTRDTGKGASIPNSRVIWFLSSQIHSLALDVQHIWMEKTGLKSRLQDTPQVAEIISCH